MPALPCCGNSRTTSGNLFNNISDTGSSFGMVDLQRRTVLVSNLKVDTANFNSLHGPNSGDLGTGFASTTFGSGSISTVELDNVSVTNTGNGGNLQDIAGLTINGFTGTGGNTANTGGLALLISHGSGFQLSNFSFSGYRTGISLFSNGTGNSIDGSRPRVSSRISVPVDERVIWPRCISSTCRSTT